MWTGRLYECAELFWSLSLVIMLLEACTRALSVDARADSHTVSVS